MAQAKTNDTVKVHYTGRLNDGTVFDSSVEREPLQFTLGEGQVIPGFENAVLGMTAGESKMITIAADQAYGPRRDDLVLAVGATSSRPTSRPKSASSFRSGRRTATWRWSP